MLLKDYLRERLNLPSFAARFDRPDVLPLISWFELGLRYDIVMNSGTRITIGDSNTLFSIIYDEMAASGRHLPQAKLYPQNVLRITPYVPMAGVTDKELRKALGEIQLWVTEFSLTDAWGTDVPRAGIKDYGYGLDNGRF